MQRRERRRSLGVALLAAVTIAASSAVSVAGALPEKDLPPRPTWRVDVANPSMLWGPEFAHGDVYVPTTAGVIVYPRRCVDGCDPLWRSKLREDRAGYRVTARAGYVTAAGAQRLHLFAAACADDGGVCTPSWRAGGRVLSAHILRTSVVVTFSKDAGIRVAVFPLECTDVCVPT